MCFTKFAVIFFISCIINLLVQTCNASPLLSDYDTNKEVSVSPAHASAQNSSDLEGFSVSLPNKITERTTLIAHNSSSQNFSNEFTNTNSNYEEKQIFMFATKATKKLIPKAPSSTNSWHGWKSRKTVDHTELVRSAITEVTKATKAANPITLSKLDLLETNKLSTQPKYTKNYNGNWLYNPWGLTTKNHLWQDTLFHEDKRYTIPRLYINSYQPKNYKVEHIGTICAHRSTAYNIPKVLNWLEKRPANSETFLNSRPILMELREKVYVKGKSEQCHTRDYNEWHQYIECALLRNQRIESHLPRYPVHQL